MFGGTTTGRRRTSSERLNADFRSAVVITVVPGGILATADLVRQLSFDIEMDYISCPHTPGDCTNASTIVYHQNIPIVGRDVIVVDDAIESGGIMKRLVEHLAALQPASLSTATLLVKPGRVHIPVQQYYGVEMDSDEMPVGYARVRQLLGRWVSRRLLGSSVRVAEPNLKHRPGSTEPPRSSIC